VGLGSAAHSRARRRARRTTAGAAWALFAYSIVYLGLLFAAMALDRLLA